jgi:Fic family protein
MSPRRPFRPEQPYNGLPGLPPKADLETRAILKACIGARAALAELKTSADLIPNPAVLINTIPLLEARASSEIENIVTTADRLFQFAQDDGDAATKEALRYRTALRRGFDSLATHPLTTSTAVEVCRTIRGVRVDVRKVPGTALKNQKTGKVVYTPPEGEARLRDLLGNWEKFLHGDTGIDPLVRMAVAHYQFEAIHPFTDGNGRTGRVLNLLFLVEQELLRLPILYMSRAILNRKTDYYRLLLAVTTAVAWEAWVLFMVGVTEETARWTTAKIKAVHELLKRTAEHVKARAPKLYSYELVELMFTQPYCRIGNLVDAGIVKRQAASEYLKKLVAIDVLREKKVGREKLFINPRLMKLLTSERHDVPAFSGSPSGQAVSSSRARASRRTGSRRS